MSRFTPLVLISIVASVFAFFPLTDTDIWWHLACGREWVSTWTPTRLPIVNVHYFFQQIVYFIYNAGGALLLVVFKALLWGLVFALFIIPFVPRSSSSYSHNTRLRLNTIGVPILVLFVLRYQMEMRPILFSLLILGVYWNLVPWLFRNGFRSFKAVFVALVILCLQYFWCKCQGLFVLGPIFASLCFVTQMFERKLHYKTYSRIFDYCFLLFLWITPFFFYEGLSLFLYPFGLLNRLIGVSPSAVSFASKIAENRSPITILMSGENIVQSSFIIILCIYSLIYSVYMFVRKMTLLQNYAQSLVSLIWLVIVAVLALIAERNVTLFIPVFLAYTFLDKKEVSLFVSWRRTISAICAIAVALIFGMWCKSLGAYDSTMISKQRIPIDAARWMVNHPHKGKLFNDDRAGGYLAFVNPSDSVYLDGRFILKTSDFFERYLSYAEKPADFIHDMDSLGVDRAIFPLQYYARWSKLLIILSLQESWSVVYRDEYFVVFDHEIKK